MTFRRDLAALLDGTPRTAHDIARLMEVPVKEVADDLAHLRKSLKHQDRRLAVQPAVCNQCGFVFSKDKYTRPGKCPRCRGTWIADPVLEITTR